MKFWFQSNSDLYQLGLMTFTAENWLPTERFLSTLPPFYRTLVKIWKIVEGGRQVEQPCSYEEAILEPLWGNALIRDKHNRPLYFPSLARAGFHTVKDLLQKPPPQPHTRSAILPNSTKGNSIKLEEPCT